MLANEAKRLFYHLGELLIELGKSLQPLYWKCCRCGHVAFEDSGLKCKHCRGGIMITIVVEK